jgi:hypothetical protein
VIATDNGMRPPGVTLIPRRSARALEDAIRGVLAATPRRQARVAHAHEDNLEALLSVYRELTS